MGRGRSHPWAELRARPWISLQWARLSGCSGQLVDVGFGRRVLYLSAGLDRVARRAVLAHELIHDERGIFYSPSTPIGLVEVEERAVRREVARWLVPFDDLARMALRGEPLTAALVASDFDVPEDVALLAVWLWRQQALPLGA